MVFPDNPIKKPDDDLLNRGPLAGRIAQLILAKRPEHPMVLALQGSWGAGKSSVLALVENELGQETIVLWYEPWFYNNPAQMIAGYLDVVASALAKAGKKRRYSNRARELVGKYGSLLSSIPFTPDVSVLGGVSPEHLRAEIGGLAAEIKKRVVVLVDDVDRLPADEMLLILKLVRLCSDFPYFTYLLAFDKKVVKRALARSFEGDSDFIEKIVQIEIPLPPVDDLLLGQFLGKHLTELCHAGGRDPGKALEDFLHLESAKALRHVGFFELVQREPLFASLREAKRYLNAVEATAPLVLADVNLFDFLALEYVRVFLPACHEEIYRLRYVVTQTDSSFGGDHGREERQTALRSLAEMIGQESRGRCALRLLFEVFPVLDAAVNRPTYHYGPSQLPGWARDLRARHPAFVDRYFRLEIPPDAVSRGEVREILSRIAANPDRIAAVLDEVIARYRAKGRILGLLEAIEMERGTLSVKLREQLTVALGKRAEELTQQLAGASMFDTPLPSLCHTLFRLLDESDAQAQQGIATSIVNDASQLRLAACFYYMATPGDEYQAPLPALDVARLHEVLSTQLTSIFVEQRRDLFADLPNDWPFFLRIWAQPDVVTPVLVRSLEQHPSYWVKVASLAIETDFRQRRALVLKGLATYTNIRELAEAATDVVLDIADETEQTLARRFLALLRVVPDLVSELRDIARVAQAVSTSSEATATWSTPVWDQWSAVLKGWWRERTWWAKLEGLYRDWRELRDAIGAIDPGAAGANAGAELISRREQIVPIADSVREVAEELAPLLDSEMESLPALPVDEGFNLADDGRRNRARASMSAP